MGGKSKASFKILGIAGSLRRASYNRGLLRAAVELAPEGAQIETFEIGEIPPFNQDLEANPPPVVARLKAAMRAADALLICTPEYNYSVPGLLKNAIDWVSRPYGDSALTHKPIALMGATIGISGTARAQAALRQSFVSNDAYCMAQPEVLISNCTGKFDENGNLTDEDTRQYLRKVLMALVAWAKQVTGQPG
jgi:chromate reductase